MSIEIVKAVDMEKLKSFIENPEIWDYLSDVASDPKYFAPQNTDYCVWLWAINEKKNKMGIIYLNHLNSYTLQVHPYILDKYIIFSRKIMKAFYGWFLRNIPGPVIKLTVSVPTSRRSSINFVKKIGFKMEGNNTKSYVRDGIVYDQINFGMTIDDMRELI